MRLAELRRRQGRREEALRLFEQASDHPLAAVGLAAAALDGGDAETAAEIASSCPEALPSKMRALRSLPLEILVRALGDLGDTKGARGALADLRVLAGTLGTLHVAAAGDYCAGTIARAEGDFEAARAGFQRGAKRYAGGRSPSGAANEPTASRATSRRACRLDVRGTSWPSTSNPSSPDTRIAAVHTRVLRNRITYDVACRGPAATHPRSVGWEVSIQWRFTEAP